MYMNFRIFYIEVWHTMTYAKHKGMIYFHILILQTEYIM